MDKIERKIDVKIDLNKSKAIEKLLNFQKLESEIDFVINQLHNKSEKKSRGINPIPVAKLFNLPYGSKIALLLTLYLEDKQ
jgi:hypothetical protein